MVKENVFRPRSFVVAVFANCSLRCLVWIVVLVAQTAGRRRMSVEDRLDMASDAFNARVSTAEGVVRIDVVIEIQLRPLRGNVARVTAFPKMPIMIIIVVMAGVAGCAQLIGKRVVTMAIVADQRCMLAGQAE